MIKVISIGTDRNVFDGKSAVHARLLKQAKLFGELHTVVFTRQTFPFAMRQKGNLWLYPTNSLSRWLYVRDALNLARGLIQQRNMTATDTVITAQDPFECGLVAVLASKQRQLAVQLQVHTDFLNPEFSALSVLNKIRVFIARRVLPRARGIRVVSARVADSLRASGINITAPIDVLPVFSAQALLWATKPLRRDKKESGHGCLALLPSRFAPEKDISTALKALERLREAGEEIGLAIAGQGFEEAKIHDEIALRGLTDGVRVERWQSDLSPFYRAADAVLLTSLFEGFGLVLLEAAAHGKSIVTTDVGIARELVLSPYERFVCAVGDAECIASRLRELAHDETLRKKYGSALRAAAKKLLIPEGEYWQRYKKLLERCLE